LNRPDKKIITAEDPVEYNFAGMNQCQVRSDIGLTFTAILRSMLRQAPNIILVGEIRDQEVADIAIQAALTGHLVFSTLHTNDAAGAITRLLDMGVESFLLSSTLLGVLAQRLVRVICPHCKEPTRPDDKLLNSMDIGHDEASKIEFFAGKGCEECRYTGFRGRTAIFEYLPVDDDIRKEITERSSNERIKDVAMGKGLMTLRQDGWRKVRGGVTTISEVLKVTLEK